MKPILLNQSRKSSKIYIMLKYHLSGFFCGYSEMGKFCNFFIGGGGVNFCEMWTGISITGKHIFWIDYFMSR